MQVEDIGRLASEPFPQPRYIAKGFQAFFSDRPIEVLRAARPNTLRQRPVRCNDRYPVSETTGIFRQFNRNQFRAAQVQRDQSLNDMHGGTPGSVDQAVAAAAVRTGGCSGFLYGKINPGMRVPEFLIRHRARKRQVFLPHLVFTFCAGSFQVGIGGICGMCHEENSRFFDCS